MNELVYPREKTLGKITIILGVIVWIALVIGTVGTALIGLGIAYLMYLFIQSTLISYIKGNGVKLSETQFPDLYTQFIACCDRLQIKKIPEAYILTGNGSLNAFATKFLGTQYVVLMSDVVDAMAKHEDGVRFYIGHELGHLRMKHLSGHFYRWPVLWLPLLGAAYSRARESTCDRHGLACCATSEGAVRALAALSAGADRWKQLDIASYLNQVKETSGFWMSFHELTTGYPWLIKRAARVSGAENQIPSRNFFAYILSAFIPYAGRLGAGFGVLMMVYIIGILAAIAIPAYQDYTIRAKLSVPIAESKNIRDALAQYYQSNQKIPDSLSTLGLPETLADGTKVTMDAEKMTIFLNTKVGEIIFEPTLNSQGRIVWECSNGEGVKLTQLPPSCHSTK